MTVAWAVCTSAWRASSVAWARSTAAVSLSVFSVASGWPFFTVSLKSASTVSIVPESSLEISTWLIGCSVPVAATLNRQVAARDRGRSW
ncbi:MAG: hypothetical protein WDM84_09215 [Bauldia sp.]